MMEGTGRGKNRNQRLSPCGHWGGVVGSGVMAKLIEITIDRFFPSGVRGALGRARWALNSSTSCSRAARGPGPASMSSIASILRCCLWWHSRSPPSRRHSSSG